MSVILPRRRYFLLAREVEPRWWELRQFTTAPSTNTSTSVVVGTNPRCTFLKYMPGSYVTEPGDYGGFERVNGLVLASGENRVYDLAVVPPYLFAVSNDFGGRIVRIDLETFTRVDALPITAPSRIVSDGEYLYVGCATGPATLHKVDPLSLSVVGSVVFNPADPDTGYPGENRVNSLAVDDTYLYAGIGEGDVKIVRLDKNTLTRVGEVYLPITFPLGSPGIAALASSDSYLYAAADHFPVKIVKVELSTFTLVGLSYMPNTVNACHDIDVLGDYLFGGIDAFVGGVFKVHAPSLSYVGEVRFGPGESTTYRIEVFRGQVYATKYSDLGGVVKVDPDTLAILGFVRLDMDGGYTFSLAASRSDLYAGSYTSPGRISQISDSIFSGWRTACPIKWQFEAGDWAFSLKLHNPSSQTLVVRPMLRLYRVLPERPTIYDAAADVMAPEPVTIPPDTTITVAWNTPLPEIGFNSPRPWPFSEYALGVEIKLHVRQPSLDPTAECVLVCNEVGTDASWIETPPLRP
jgi:hypothetical protein